MGWFDGIGSMLSAAGAAVCTGIGNLCSSIGGSFFSGGGGIMSWIAPILEPFVKLPQIGLILEGIRFVADIVSFIAEALGLKEKEEEDPEELGIKAEEAEKKPDDFDSTQEYIEYLRNEVEIDKKKVEKLSDEDRAKYCAVGMGIYIKGIEEKYRIEAPGEFWRTVADKKMTGEEVKTYMDTFKEHGITDMNDMANFIKGKEGECKSNSNEVSNSITEALKKIYPEMTEEEIEDKYIELCTGNNN